MNASIQLAPGRTAAVMLLVLAAIVTTDLVLQKVEFDRRGSVDYAVHWGWVPPEPGVDYPGWLFEEVRFRFDLDQEYNISSWFQSALLLGIAALMLAVAAAAGRAGGVLQWRVLAAVFVFLSLDEIASLHELLGLRPESPGTRLGDLLGLRQRVFFDWVLVSLPFVTGIALFTLPLLLRLPRGIALLLLAAAAIYLSGALGVETLAGNYVNSAGFDVARYRLLVAAEEWLEGSGAIVAIFGLLSYGRRLQGAAAEAPVQALTRFDLVLAAAILFLVGIASHVAADVLLFESRPPATAPAEAPPPVGAEPPADGTQPSARPTCDEISGGDYQSDEERDWFLANCL